MLSRHAGDKHKSQRTRPHTHTLGTKSEYSGTLRQRTGFTTRHREDKEHNNGQQQPNSRSTTDNQSHSNRTHLNAHNTRTLETLVRLIGKVSLTHAQSSSSAIRAKRKTRPPPRLLQKEHVSWHATQLPSRWLFVFVRPNGRCEQRRLPTALSVRFLWVETHARHRARSTSQIIAVATPHASTIVGGKL
jgi:hypothetical protein